MSKKNWQRINNFFIPLANRSLIRFYFLTNKVMANLANQTSDPYIETIYNDSIDDHIEFKKIFRSKAKEKTNSKGKNKILKQKFEELKKVKLPIWQGAIMQKLLPNTVEYELIMENGRTGINRGSYDVRLMNLEKMRDELADYPTLATTYTEVNTFYTELETLLNGKSDKINDIELVGKELKDATKKMAVRMFSIYGKLTSYYASDPEKINTIFPLKLLSSKKKSIKKPNDSVKINIASQQIKEAGLSFNQNQKIYVAMLSGESVKIWFSQTKDTTSIPVNATEIIEGDDLELIVKENAGIDDRFLMLANTSQTDDAKIDVSLYDSK
jgi:hypothetical protein